MSAGYIYILKNAAYPGDLLKIGRTTRTPLVRARELSASTGVPSPFEVAFEIRTVDCNYAEVLIHNRLDAARYNAGREFFQVPLDLAIRTVESAVAEVEATPLKDRVFGPVDNRLSEDLESEGGWKTKLIAPTMIPTNITSRRATLHIKKTTHTAYRQNRKALGKEPIYYDLSGYNWIGAGVKTRAIVFFCSGSMTLVVIPRRIVDKFIFEPLFDSTENGAVLKREHREIEYGDQRIALKFSVRDDRLLISLQAHTRADRAASPLISLPPLYWPEIEVPSNEVGEMVRIVNDMCRELSTGQGIVAL